MGEDLDEFQAAITSLLSGRPPALAADGLAQKHGLARVGMDLLAAYQEIL
jgi:hypothetical protein